MSLPGFVALVLVLLVLYLLSAIWRYRIQKGSFRPFSGRSGKSSLGFESESGCFTLSPTKATLGVATPGETPITCDFSDLVSLEVEDRIRLVKRRVIELFREAGKAEWSDA